MKTRYSAAFALGLALSNGCHNTKKAEIKPAYIEATKEVKIDIAGSGYRGTLYVEPYILKNGNEAELKRYLNIGVTEALGDYLTPEDKKQMIEDINSFCLLMKIGASEGEPDVKPEEKTKKMPFQKFS